METSFQLNDLSNCPFQLHVSRPHKPIKFILQDRSLLESGLTFADRFISSPFIREHSRTKKEQEREQNENKRFFGSREQEQNKNKNFVRYLEQEQNENEKNISPLEQEQNKNMKKNWP